MKVTDMAIIVVFIIVALFSANTYNQQRMIKSDQLLSRYNEVIDNSVEDATKELLHTTDNGSFEISAEGKKVNYQAANLNLDKALWRFYKTLFSNLNIEDDYMQQQALMDKIPLKMAVGYDGYYINTWQELPDAIGSMKLQEHWENKINYSMMDKKNNIEINFTLDDYVYINDLTTHESLEGKQDTFITKYPNSVFGPKFDDIRRQVITNTIEKDIKYYTEFNNSLAEKYGLGYTFTIPYIDSTAINNVSFVAFLQGVPFEGIQKLYNNYGFGIARTANRHKWYGYTINGINYYHSDKYTKTGSNKVVFDTPQAAAKAGYYPDPECN